MPDAAVTPETGFQRGQTGNGTDLVVLGDSHAMALAPMLDQIAVDHRLSASFWIAIADRVGLERAPKASPIGLDARQLHQFDDGRTSAVRAKPKLVVVALRHDVRRFKEVRSLFELIRQNSRLVVIQQPPMLNTGNRPTATAMADLLRRGGDLGRLEIREPSALTRARRAFESELVVMFGGHPGFQYFRTEEELLQADGRIRWWDGGSELCYRDDDHLTEAGASRFKARLERVLLDACR